VTRHRPVVIAVAAIVLVVVIGAFLAFFCGPDAFDDRHAWFEGRRNGGSQTRDAIQTLIVALGPAAVSVCVTLLASLVARSRSAHRALGFVALGFIVVQVGVLYGVWRLFGGGAAVNPLTLTGAAGLVICIGALVLHFVRGPRRVGDRERRDRAS
jgi:ABC-type Fe3+ transport system permease subunit